MARGAARDESPADVSFEGALERLETLVDQLESGDLPLEEALSAFEEGVALSRRCAEQLETAERRIEALVDPEGGLRTEPFSAEDEQT
jgi:exodeoxyribonuclease VII small subunit